MRHQCHGGKWSEDEVRSKSKHKTIGWENGETYQSPVPAPSCEKPFERIKDRIKGCYNRGHSVQMIIKKNRASMALYASKGQNRIMMFYLKANIYAPEGQQAIIYQSPIRENRKK